MAHEEQHTSSSSRFSKKLKQKKLPQRGLGVAQLEKIISEDRQLKDAEAAVLKPNFNLIKFRRPAAPLPPPNRHHLISKSDCSLFNFDCQITPSPNPNRYMPPANQGGFRYESGSSIWPQVHTQRSHFHQPSSSSMVNVSLGTSSSSATSSVMNYQIEPPSIQSFCGNKYPSFMPDGDKMVELKRSYPFSMENMPIPSFNCNTPSAYAPPISKSDESGSCSHGGTASLQHDILFCRENSSSLGLTQSQKSKKCINGNLDLAKDFLTLAPPHSSPASHSRAKEKLLSYQGQTRYSSELEWPYQQPLHSFIPPSKIEGSSNGEVGEHVDLSLKL
ncbi:hypothetical protein QVD17_05443 [Tagetes erecta]|uniref:Uncharacterized protein n=1 Tax=Tagetes erecta TaxID=13708 RepID=A0AAD8PAJ2_TARER|nr:hypothetical protein QVD17_05443 [Tagetes erecta]